MLARIVALHIGQPQTRGQPGATDPMERPWTSGIFKLPVAHPLWLSRTGFAGDGQADLRHHGGPEKAVFVYPIVHYPTWQQELHRTDFTPGAFGENVIVDGLTETDVCIGDIYAMGSARVQLSQPRQPCWKPARRWQIKDLALRIQVSGRTGWYVRVLDEGEVAPGASIQLLDRLHPEWTVSRANTIMHHQRHDQMAAAALAACAALAPSWRDTLRTRAASGRNPDEQGRLVGPNREA
jgi:MOSC domain-containing protein YiiM